MTTTLHEKLGRLKEQRRFSERALAHEITTRSGREVSDSTVRRWLNGKSIPDLKFALCLSRILGVDLDYLADDSLDAPSGKPRDSEEEHVLWLTRKLGLEKAIARLTRDHDERTAPAAVGNGQSR